MQILTRLKKALIMVRAESNQVRAHQSKLELNSVSFRARFHRDTIGLRTESDQAPDEVLLGV